MGLLDVLFPKKCVACQKMGEYICSSCFANISFDTALKCLICEKPTLDGLTHPKCRGKYTIDGYVVGVAYKKLMKKLLYQFKYQPYLSDLQTVLVDLLYEQLIQSEVFHALLKTRPILVPIPLTPSRLRKRGYNQAELLAKGIGKKFELHVQSLLKRTKETKPQYGLSREERMENMKGAFEIKGNILRHSGEQSDSRIDSGQARMTTKTAILVDDVLTTGSTFKEAAKMLKKNGFGKVWGIVLAQD